MPSTPDFAQDFVSKLTNGVPLQEALALALLSEAELRRKFATDRSNSILDNPFAGIINVFASNQAIRLVEARKIQDDVARDAKYIFPLKPDVRKPSNAPAMAENIDQFRTSWNIFTEGALSQLTDWNNVVAAGGAVLASLLPLPEHARGSKRAIRKYFHEETTYSTSDIDLFLYGLTPEQAEQKAIQIYEAVCDSVPWDTVCVRTKHTISIHSQYPYRPIQIILRLYKSPTEILAGFDIDCACFLYDGNHVWGNPRGVAALKAQANLVDMTRRSPSYEVRLAKYSDRGFEVSVPNLKREDVDPTIFERSINRIEGLARLLVLEKLSDPDDRTKYLERRRILRGRPEAQGYSRRAMRRRRKVRGDLKAAAEMFGGVSASDYGTQSFHIPYGPGFDSKKVEKFIYGTDLGMNSTFNPKNKDRRLHRHPAFFGTMVEVMNDCCEYCPEPLTSEEKELQGVEDAQYIRGRVEFMQEDPGRQMMTGSFHPIDEGEWSIQAYLGPVEKLFRAVSEGDLETVRDIVEGGFDLQRRDHVGRTALHLAIMAKSETVSSYLVDSGARITARLVDGRTSLHLASQLGLNDIVSKLIDKSRQNEKKAEEDKAAAEAAKEKEKKDKDGDSEMGDNKSDEDDGEGMEPSSEDDWDSDGEPRERKRAESVLTTTVNDPPTEGSAIPEDNEELPDILEINAIDWDFMYSPLAHAIVAGHTGVVEVLINAGADVTTPFKKGPTYSQVTCYPLTLTLLTEDKLAACAIAEKLLENGASCTAADDSLKTVFHQAVLAKNVELVKTFIRVDPNAKTAMDFLPQLSYNEAASPLVSAVGLNERAMATLLISSGASVKITPEMFDKSWNARYSVANKNRWVPQKQEDQWLRETSFPVESALAQRSDLVIPVIQLGADLNLGLRTHNEYNQDKKVRRTILDSLRESISYAEHNLKQYERLSGRQPQPKPTAPGSLYQNWEESDDTLEGWMTGQVKKAALREVVFVQRPRGSRSLFAGVMMPGSAIPASMTTSGLPQDTTTPYKALISAANAQLDWLREVEKIVIEHGGKTAKELNAEDDAPHSLPMLLGADAIKRSTTQTPKKESNSSSSPTRTVPLEYKLYRPQHQTSEPVAEHQKALYVQLFTACWKGDTKTVERLCLPPKSGKRDRHATYIQIAAEVLPSIGGMGGGYSTLAVAVLAKRWETAKVIISIAKAQYQKDEEEDPRPFQPFENSDGSDEEYDSDMSVDDYNEPVSKPQLVDLANRLSTVKTSVGPDRLFGTYYTMLGEEIFARGGSPLTYALEDADVHAVEQALALGQMCDPPITIGPQHLRNVIVSDEPAMLDYVIRRYGFGLSIQTDEDEHEPTIDEHDGEVSNRKKKASKTYLGLNVQGRKRKDLAAKGDPDAPTMIAESPLPLTWLAAQLNAPKILAWLVTSAPLNAYKAYMKSSNDEAALAMKRMAKFEQRFPDLIGLTVNDVGENVVLAHLSGGAPKIETIKLLFSLFPDLKTAFVYRKLEGLKITTLHYVCAMNLATEIFDFFLEKAGTDPVITDRDYKGCNILHTVVSKGHLKLLKHIFTKLTRDQLGLMLSQTTYSDQDTPLMLAVKAKSTSAVEFLLAFDHPVTIASLATRDSDGSLPLHMAVTKGYAEITKRLLGTSPKSLFVEDGLGSTPLEQAEFRYILWHSNNGLGGQSGVPSRWNSIAPVPYLENAEIDIMFSSSWIRQLFNSIPEYGKITSSEVQDLDATVQYLEGEGRFMQQPAVKQVLDEYLKRCHDSAAKSTAFEALRKEVRDAEAKELVLTPMDAEILYIDLQDAKATYEVVRSAVAASGIRKRRELVHLLDAQRAVDTALKAATKKRGDDGENQFQFPGGYYQQYRRRTYGNRPDDLDLTERKDEIVFRYSLGLQNAVIEQNPRFNGMYGY